MVNVVPVSVTKPASSALCPGTVPFTWVIDADGPGTVTYDIARSDGATRPGPSTLTFERAGRRTVTDTWTLGRAYSGWETLEIRSPRPLRSQLDFSFACAASTTTTTTTFNVP